MWSEEKERWNKAYYVLLLYRVNSHQMNEPDTLDVLKMLIFVLFIIIIIIIIVFFLWLICDSIRSSYSSILITGCKDFEANNNNKRAKRKNYLKKITTCCMDLAFDPVRWRYTKYVYEYIQTNLDGEHGVFAITLFVNNERREWHHLVHKLTGKVREQEIRFDFS